MPSQQGVGPFWVEPQWKAAILEEQIDNVFERLPRICDFSDPFGAQAVDARRIVEAQRSEQLRPFARDPLD